MRRLPIIAAIVLVSILVTPYAITPGFNSADLIIVAAPVAILIVAWPHRRRPHDARTRSELCRSVQRPQSARFRAHRLVERIDDTHPDALGSLDLRDRGL